MLSSVIQSCCHRQFAGAAPDPESIPYGKDKPAFSAILVNICAHSHRCASVCACISDAHIQTVTDRARERERESRMICGSPMLWCFAHSGASKNRKLQLIGKITCAVLKNRISTLLSLHRVSKSHVCLVHKIQVLRCCFSDSHTRKIPASKSKIVCIFRDRKNRDSQRCDRILRFFLRPEIGQFLLNYTKGLETKENIHWRKQRPEIADFCPLSWSNVS